MILNVFVIVFLLNLFTKEIFLTSWSNQDKLSSVWKMFIKTLLQQNNVATITMVTMKITTLNNAGY